MLKNNNIGDNNENPEKQEKSEKKKKFTVPGVEEVQEYCTERGNNIDAQHFIDYYSARGWMLGKNHIKDWKACVRTWERNDNFKPQQKQQEEPKRQEQPKAVNPTDFVTDNGFDVEGYNRAKAEYSKALKRMVK